MNISNNNVNKTNMNYGSKMKETPKTEDEKLLDFAIKSCGKMIAESAQRHVPECNKFAPHMISFLIPGTQNVATITIKQDEEEFKTQRRILISVHHKNSDVEVSNYIFKGNKKEVLEYLNSLPDKAEELAEIIKELSRQSDDYHSGL